MIQPTDRQMHNGRVAGAPHGSAASAALWLLACGLCGLGGVAQGQTVYPPAANLPSGNYLYWGSPSVISNNGFAVSGSAAVSFMASGSIVLGNGFTATAGATGTVFQAGIAAAPPAPVLSGVSPSSGVQGTSVPVTLTGGNFVTLGTAVSASTGISVSNVLVANANQITATLIIGSNAPVGNGTVTVTTAGGSATATFAVQAAATQTVTLQTSPPNLQVTVGGVTLGTPYTWTCSSGSISVGAPAAEISGVGTTRYLFGSWSDAGAQTHNINCPASSTTLTASFPTTQYYLIMTAGSNGAVSPANGWHYSGEPVTVSATPSANYTFSGWSGSGPGSYSGTSQSTNVTMNGPISQTASFTGAQTTVTIQTYPPGLQVTAGGANQGTPYTWICSSGSSTTVSISAAPQSGGAGIQFAYGSWSDSGVQTHNITCPASSTTLTASFTTQYYLTMTAGANGTVGPASGWFSPGQPVTISAAPSNGYNFGGWSGTGYGSYSGTGQSASITMNGPVSETAGFTGVQTTVTLVTSPPNLQITVGGVAQSSPYQWTCSTGGSISVGMPSPQSGGTGTQYVYSSWSDGFAQAHTINCPSSSTTDTANLTTQYYLTMTAGSNGAVSPASGWYNSGQSVPISGTPSTGYSFSAWTGSGSGAYSGATQSASVTLNGPVSETASFVLAPPADFTVSVGPATTAAGSNAVYALTVTPLNGFNTTVSFAVSGLPALAGVGSIATQGWQTTLTVSTQSCTPLGTATPAPTLTATSGSLSHSYSLSLTVTNPGSGAPVVCGISPTSGPVGTPVTIWGVNFGSAQGSVTFGSVQATVASGNWGATSILTAVPAGAVSGPVVVTAGGNSSNGIGFAPTGPNITGIPASGVIGSLVMIVGTGFGSSKGGSTVAFNGVPAVSFDIWNDGSITVQVPAGATSGNITVTVNNVQAISPTTFTVGPYITSLSPQDGVIGAQVNIGGLNFGSSCSAGQCAVSFNGVPAAVVWRTSTSITTAVPAGAATGMVIVTVDNMASNAVIFTVDPTIATVTPSSGRIAVDDVVIRGSNFGASQGTSTVTFNGTQVPVGGWGDTVIYIPALPCSATSGNVVVTRSDGYASNGVPFTVTPETVSGPLGPATLLDSSGNSASAAAASAAAAVSQYRLQLVFVGDGYTKEQLDAGLFSGDVQREYLALFSEAPFSTYQGYFNVYRVDVASLQCGASNTVVAPPIAVNNFFGSSYHSGNERLLFGDGGQVQTVLSNAGLPATRSGVSPTAIVLVNDNLGGGTGGNPIWADTATPETVKHELGHSLGLLLDEYTFNPPECNPNTSGPNVATSCTDFEWTAWVANPSCPATDTATNPAVPNLYLGAAYCANLYRPTYDSKMRTLGSPWNQINTEQLIARFYKNMLFPDGPPQNTVVNANQGDQVSLQPQLPPNQTTFNYTWMIGVNDDGSGGSPICGGNGTGPMQCAVDTTTLSVGTHNVQVSIQDATGAVKSAVQKHAVTNTLMWKLIVGACAVVKKASYSQSAPYTQEVSAVLSDGHSGYTVEQSTDTDETDSYYCDGNLVSTVDVGAISTSSVECTVSDPVTSQYGAPYLEDDPYCPNTYMDTCQDYWDTYAFTCSDGEVDYESLFSYSTCVCSVITYNSAQPKPALGKKVK